MSAAMSLDWPRFLARFQRRFGQGDQVTILGGPDAGKTHLSVLIAEQRRFAFFLATKPRDPLLAQLQRRGWAISSTLEPMDQLVELEEKGKPVKNPDGTPKMEPLYPRFVYWPLPEPGAMTLEEEADLMRAVVARALARVRRYVGYAIVLDETNYLTGTLQLRRSLEQLWHTGRTSLHTIIASAQRPSWIPRAALDNAGHFFVFGAADREELRRLGEITGGLDWRPLAEEIATLNWHRHEFLYVGTRDRAILRSIAPPW